MSADRHCYRARWLFPVGTEPIENGTIEIEAGRITAVHAGNDPDAENLGNAAVIPGLVNAHAHLEFSGLEQPLGPANPFTDWIRAVVATRRDARHLARQSISCGYRESAEAGTCTLAEITTGDWPSHEAAPNGPRVVLFRELLGFLPEQIDRQLAIARAHLERSAWSKSTGSGGNGPERNSSQPKMLYGISPHAPYSVHPDLFGRLVALAIEFRAPLAIHLAETRAELELLAWGTGEFVDMLREFGVWGDDLLRIGSKPIDYLRSLEKLDHGLVVHGNYLSADEIEFIAGHRNLCVVYCPRTHAYFGHSEHPWRELLRRGALLALGTDSRASNPDLSLWRELVFLRRRFPHVDPQTLLELGTLGGARALGLNDQTGSLSVGKSADLAIVSLARAAAGDAYSLLFDHRSRITAGMCIGRWFNLRQQPAG